MSGLPEAAARLSAAPPGPGAELAGVAAAPGDVRVAHPSAASAQTPLQPQPGAQAAASAIIAPEAMTEAAPTGAAPLDAGAEAGVGAREREAPNTWDPSHDRGRPVCDDGAPGGNPKGDPGRERGDAGEASGGRAESGGAESTASTSHREPAALLEADGDSAPRKGARADGIQVPPHSTLR